MRLLNRSAGRLSRHRRGPLAGLARAAARAAAHRRPVRRLLARPRPTSTRPTPSQVAQGKRALPRRLRVLPRPERRGRHHRATAPDRPVAGRRRRRRRRLPGRHRPHADGPARRRRRRARSRSYNDEEIAALAAYVASLGPGPADPRRGRLRVDGLSEEERRRRSPAVARSSCTNCTACHNFDGAGGAHAARRLRPAAPRRRAQVHLRGHAHRPADDAQLHQRQPLARGEAGRHRLPRQPSRTRPSYGGFALGGLGPVSEGLFAWLVGIGGLVASPSGSPPTRPARPRSKVDA